MKASSETFAEQIERLAGGADAIEGAVIGHEPGTAERVPVDKRGKLLSWQEARPLLDFTYDDGYGEHGLPPSYIWSTRWVLVTNEYDGATGPCRIPRQPASAVPHYGGEGDYED